jgi:hypothetical protein
MIYLNLISWIGEFRVMERWGKDFRRIRKLQPKDPISCRYVVFRGDTCLEEFRRRKSAERFCQTSSVSSVSSVVKNSNQQT